MPNEVKFLNVEPGGHLHRRSSMVHGGSFLLDSASYGAAVLAPAIARKRSARFASMIAECKEAFRGVNDCNCRCLLAYSMAGCFLFYS